MTHSILIVEDEETLRKSLKRVFEREGYLVDAAESAEVGLAMTECAYYDVIISDIILPEMDGIEMLTKIRESAPSQTFIVTTAYASLDTAVRALRVGAYDYIMKPIIHEEIKKVVCNAIEQDVLRKENRRLKRQLALNYDFANIIGSNGALADIIEEVQLVSETAGSVLLLGDTGTGKGFFARVIHHNSDRRTMPFVPINCSAIPENLLESELFGHVKGAFTGAVTNKQGLLHEADGGTIFLDEIGDMPLTMQVKLLKVLEDQEIRPVGSTRVKKVDLRIIAATNMDLAELIQAGRFREDLLYRINVFTLELPPLRERRDDIGALAEHYLKKYADQSGKACKTLSEDALALMQAYEWPGNIRELQNVLERAALICREPEIAERFLPKSILARDAPERPLARVIDLSIEDYIQAFVKQNQDRLSETELAEKLGITRKTLWEKRKRWNLRRA